MRRIALSGLALALTLGSASLVAAQQPAQGEQAPTAQKQHQARRGQWQRGHGNMRRQLFKDVKLTNEQKAQIKSINQKYRAQAKQGREALRPVMQEARADRQKGDSAAARAVFERNKGQFDKLRAQRQQELQEIRAVLTPDQQKQFDANAAQLKARAQQWQQHRRERQERKGS